MKTLLLLRHAKSSWKDASLTDHDRPLNKRGKCDAPRVGEMLREDGPLPELVLSSTAVRARRTAELVTEAAGLDGPALDASLYHAGAGEIIEAIARLNHATETALLVGHNPGMEHVIAVLTGRWESMPTAALAHLTLDIASWRDLEVGVPCDVVRVWRPK